MASERLSAAYYFLDTLHTSCDAMTRTVTEHSSQHFSKEVEVGEVVGVDVGAGVGPEETIHPLEQGVGWVDEFQTQEMEIFPVIIKKTKLMIKSLIKLLNKHRNERCSTNINLYTLLTIYKN